MIVFCFIVICCVLWSVFFYVKNFYLQDKNKEVFNAIKGEKESSFQNFNTFYEIFYLQNRSLKFQSKNCGDSITNSIMSNITFVYDLIFVCIII